MSFQPRIVCTWLETDLKTIPVLLVADGNMISPSNDKRASLLLLKHSFSGSVAVDWINDKLYWTDVGTSRIEVADLTGRSRAILINTALQYPRGLVVDPING